jgi:hypothetical protein
MSSNVVLFGWDHPIPGREQISAAHFQEFMGYLGSLQDSGSIGSWEVVFLNPHGGDLNGFFLIKGDPEQISDLIASDDWVRHMTRATLHLQDPGAVAGAAGDLVMDRFGMWSSLIPE